MQQTIVFSNKLGAPIIQIKKTDNAENLDPAYLKVTITVKANTFIGEVNTEIEGVDLLYIKDSFKYILENNSNSFKYEHVERVFGFELEIQNNKDIYIKTYLLLRGPSVRDYITHKVSLNCEYTADQRMLIDVVDQIEKFVGTE